MINLAERIAARKSGAVEKPRKIKDPSKVTVGRVLKYALLPGFGPRIRQIGQRIGGFAYFLAQIFNSCGLIPYGHPTLQAANIGYFGFSDVISTAASNLKMRRENADQIVMFGAVILSMVLLLANGLAMAAYIVLDFGTAFAADAPATVAAASGSMFVAPHQDTDLALALLFKAFGGEMFSAANAGPLQVNGGHTVFQQALYGMLGLYSKALMVVAVVIVLYYAFTVVGESAQTGQPFGKRFNSFWAPIRLVVGLGLLVPIAGGLNAAQYLTLYAAKLGSGFASYAWSGFVEKLAHPDDIIASPEPERVTRLVYNVLQNEICAAISQKYGGEGYSMLSPNYVASGPIVDRQLATTAARQQSGYSEFKWGPNAECGSIIVQKSVYAQNPENKFSLAPSYDFSAAHNGYVAMVNKIHSDLEGPVTALVNNSSSLDNDPGTEVTQEDISRFSEALGGTISTAITNINKVYSDIDADFKPKMAPAIEKYAAYGWLGAGLFYNQIADLNGIYVDAMYGSFPKAGAAANPKVLSSDYKGEINGVMARITEYTSQTPNPEFAMYSTGGEKAKMNEALRFMIGMMALASPEEVVRTKLGGEYLEKAFRSSPANPMALLSTVGADFMQKAGDMFTQAMAFSVAQVVASGAAKFAEVAAGQEVEVLGTGGNAAALFAVGAAAATLVQGYMGILVGLHIMFGTTGLLLGFFLYYVIPLLPFIFFFFATLTWVLSIIEAMVGLPLWALAHIRIDGDGLSGQAASNGYMLIFGIMLRPFLILFAYLAGLMFFSVAVSTLQSMIWNVMAAHGDGITYIMAHVIIAALYVMLVFIICLLCSKQTDQMPDQVMRWFGSSVAAYNDGQQDPTETIKSATFAAGYVMNNAGGQIANQIGGMGTSISGAGGGAYGARKNAETRAMDRARGGAPGGSGGTS